MTPMFPGLLRSMMDRVRVMLIPAADAHAAAGVRGSGYGGKSRTARSDTVYLAWCDHW